MKIARILLAMLFLSAAAAACGKGSSTITGPDDPGGPRKDEFPALGAGVG
jgi:hypothetical protein